MVTRPVEPPDSAVIVESRQDADAFAVLYDRYAAQLYRYAHRRVGAEVAEDVVAETFLAAFRARERYDVERATALPWLFAILTKELARHHRTEIGRYRTLSRLAHDAGEEELADQVAQSVTAQAQRGQLSAALARLPARDRDVILLIAWADLSYEEVAQALAIPVGTVRSRLNRARRKLRDALDYDITGGRS